MNTCYFILRLPALSASIFALAIEILLGSVEKQGRKWILKRTTLKTPFHIALFRMKLRSHYTVFRVKLLQCQNYFWQYLKWNVLVNFISFLFLFPADQSLKKLIL